MNSERASEECNRGQLTMGPVIPIALFTMLVIGIYLMMVVVGYV